MRVFNVKIHPSGVAFPAEEGKDILRSARKAGVWLPFECGWGSCGSCKATVVEGEYAELFPNAPALRPRDRQRRRIITCQTTPLSDLVLEAPVLREPPEDLHVKEYIGVLLQNQVLAPHVHRLVFWVDSPVSFIPGQYAIFHLGGTLRRAYSMCSLPGSEMEFLVRRYEGGQGSPRMADLLPGEKVRLELPYGRAYLRKTSRPIVMVAGGTGVAPILAMARSWSTWKDPPALWVFYGARTSQDLVLLTELEKALEQRPAHLMVTVNEPEEQWRGETGLVSEVVARHLPRPWSVYEWYVAGPPAMVSAVRKLLDAEEVPIAQVHYDSFG